LLRTEFPESRDGEATKVALCTVKDLLRTAFEAAMVENDRIVKLVEAERLIDDTGEPEDIAYNKALDDVLAAIVPKAAPVSG